jgi:hypothetical protein
MVQIVISQMECVKIPRAHVSVILRRRIVAMNENQNLQVGDNINLNLLILSAFLLGFFTGGL